MASVTNDPGGRRRIQFVDIDGRRKAIRVGKMSQRDAESIARHVEALLVAKKNAQPLASHTAAWLGEIGDDLRFRLVKAGLVDPPEAKAAVTLGDFLASYFARRTDVKANTVITWQNARRGLMTFFGADRLLSSITPSEARDWERWLRTGEARENRYAENDGDDGLSINTARRRVGLAKQFFQDALDRSLITRNPFAGMRGMAGSNRERDFFITREMTAKVLEACPNDEWRLLFALSRYGGLRCPSEHLALCWGDIDWEHDRMTVRSPKTERHEGKASRVVPIFPELRPLLDAVFHAADPGTEFVIGRTRNTAVNLRTYLEKIIERAGLAPWPKLWQNLRASRATELAAEYPAHVAAAWLGHSTLVAQKHYWQVTDEDFERAAGRDEVRRAAQNAAQYMHVERSKRQEAIPSPDEESLVFPSFTNSYGNVRMYKMGGTGFEPVTSTV